MPLKNSLYILLIFIIFLTPLKTVGQSLYGSGDSGSDSFYTDPMDDYTSQEAYGEGEIDYKDAPKFISPQDFADAQATIEKYGLNHKQRQKIKRRRQRENSEDKSRRSSIKPLKASPFALLRLPAAVETAGIVIKAGYYLVQSQSTDGVNQVVIAQGKKALVTLHVTDIEKQNKKVLEPFITIENINNEIIDLTLNTKDSIIKFSLPISTTE